MEVPGLWHGGPHRCQISCPALPCMCPRGGAGGRQRREGASLPEPPEPPAGLCCQCLRCAMAPWLVPLVLVHARAGIALHRVLGDFGFVFQISRA